MISEAGKTDPEAWKYAGRPSNWRSWGVVGLGLLIVVVGFFVTLAHLAGVI
jgi:hypothetical protein